MQMIVGLFFFIVYTMSLVTFVRSSGHGPAPVSNLPSQQARFQEGYSSVPASSDNEVWAQRQAPTAALPQGAGGAGGNAGGGGKEGGLRGLQDVSVVMRSSVWFMQAQRGVMGGGGGGIIF